MKRLIRFIIYTRWKPIRYCWPYEEGYGIYRKNRFTGNMTVLDRYETKVEAIEACAIQNQQDI